MGGHVHRNTHDAAAGHLLLKHKLMEVMAQREADRPLQGDISVDDAYLAGERTGHGCHGAAIGSRCGTDEAVSETDGTGKG
jgi:hypothetical protein